MAIALFTFASWFWLALDPYCLSVQYKGFLQGPCDRSLKSEEP